MPTSSILENCACPSPSPEPSCSPADSTPSGEFVRMFFGEYRTTSSIDIYFTYKHQDQSRQIKHEDFLIPNYPVKHLIDSGILPAGGDNPFTTFTLSERELLSTGTFSGWIFFGITYAEGCTSEFDLPFSVKCCKALGLDINEMIGRAARLFDELQTTRDNVAAGAQTNILIDPPTIADETKRENLLAKLEACYEWLVEIYKTYYGKQFLVKIGDKLPGKSGNTRPHSSFVGVCVKDHKGDYPVSSLSGNCPIIVDGDGSGQGLHLSDMVSREGGFPSRNTTDLLDLPVNNDNIEWITTEDGRIDSFVKFGKIEDSSGNPEKFKKFGTQFVVDLANMNPENFYIYTNTSGKFLYIKAQVHDKIYFMDDYSPSEGTTISGGQYVVVELQELVPLKLIDNKLAIIKGAIYNVLLNLARQTITNEYLRPFAPAISYLHGAIPNHTQFNVWQAQPISIFPESFVVPMKSNVYSYGPYYYSATGDSPGGTDVVNEDSICPWNFLSLKADGGLDVSKSYQSMDCVGKALSKDSTAALQQLETGRITVASLPAYGLGYAIDNGPTLLTDISVDYGSNGVSTTYNFETYTPRFGRPGQYIIDAWADNIRKIQHTNKYLKEERLRVLRQSNKIFQSKKINPEDAIGGSRKSSQSVETFREGASPNRLLISGFYFENSYSLLENSTFGTPIPSCECTGDEPFDSNCPGASSDCNPSPSCCYDGPCTSCNECECSSSPSSSPSGPETPYPTCSGNIYRLYAFAETDKGYQANHVQKETYKFLSIMSLDGLFLPVSLASNYNYYVLSDELASDGSYAGYLSRFTKYKSFPFSKSLDTLPPFKYESNDQYKLEISQKYLNPMISMALITDWDGRKNDTDRGFTISSIAYGTDFTKFDPSHDAIEEVNRQDSRDFRFNALRGPLVIQGWGYDITGKPIPNSADDPRKTEKGNFVDCRLTDKFMKNWIDNPKTWPVGPVDLRFDRKRGVWTCPTPNKILVAKLKEELSSFQSAKARLINPTSGDKKFYDDEEYIDNVDGDNIKCDLMNTEITVYDYLGISLPSCSLVYIYYLGYNKYIVLEGREVKKDKGCENDWLGHQELKNAANYKPEVKQALIHIASSGTSGTRCYEGPRLAWEDIIECSPSPSPSSNPGCTCDTISMPNGKFIELTFPYNVKNVNLSPGSGSLSNSPNCDNTVQIDLNGVTADCKGGESGNILFTIDISLTYDKCCENNTTQSCNQSFIIEYSGTEVCCDDPSYCTLTLNTTSSCGVTFTDISYS